MRHGEWRAEQDEKATPRLAYDTKGSEFVQGQGLSNDAYLKGKWGAGQQ